jgi:hypothetical protein
MAYADLGTAAVCFFTLFQAIGSSQRSTLGWRIAVLGCAGLILHALLLFAFAGVLVSWVASVKQNLYRVGGDRLGVLTGQNNAWMSRATDAGREALEGLTAVQWYTFIFFGVACQVPIIATTGGMGASPFAQILIATFILGQFRASTSRAIWGMFLAGVVFAVGTHALFLQLTSANPVGFPRFQFDARWFISPGIVVALASTFVFWISFRLGEIDNNPPTPKPVTFPILESLPREGISLQDLSIEMANHTKNVVHRQLQELIDEGLVMELKLDDTAPLYLPASADDTHGGGS